MADRESTPTKKQLDFIDRLRSASDEREAKFQELVGSFGKGDISELDMREASQVIETLKKIHVEGESAGPSSPTVKQLSFLQNLQDTEERIKVTGEYLKKLGAKALGNLSVQEASELIDRLMKIKGGQRLDTSGNPATGKQLNYIRKLQESDEMMKVYNKLMDKFKKSELDDLTKGEASELIEKMKEKE